MFCPFNIYSNAEQMLGSREKGRDLSLMTKERPKDKSKKQCDNTQMPPKTSITQRLWTDLGRQVGVTIATQLVWLNLFMGTALTAKGVHSKGQTFKKNCK